MSLRTIGDGSFRIVSGPRWIPGGLNELDALEIVYQGAYDKLGVFRNSLTKWSPSIIDGNMFLETFPDDGDGIKPKVTLRYIGCKGGQLPTPVKSQGGSLATATQTDGENELSVLYWSPHTQYSWIGKAPVNSHSGFDNPVNVVIKERRVSGHIPPLFRMQALAEYYLALATTQLTGSALSAFNAAVTARLAQLDAAAKPIKDAIKAYFKGNFQEQEQITEFEAISIVPDRYWACRSVTAKMLVPN